MTDWSFPTSTYTRTDFKRQLYTCSSLQSLLLKIQQGHSFRETQGHRPRKFCYESWFSLFQTVSLLLARWCEQYELPPVLYLQLDNCVKENKNQYILWLLALLVELKIFEKVKFVYCWWLLSWGRVVWSLFKLTQG